MKEIAIIGAGISGLSLAYYLKDDFKITLFEKQRDLVAIVELYL
ncbi:MAG UNVERIFIED_CONTAM: NAD(P)/FAD-dependent oxidoreductase [Rickettsiaceae bacterium]|jgi:oxygen-dependent protoporphyrinogen oxidase